MSLHSKLPAKPGIRKETPEKTRSYNPVYFIICEGYSEILYFKNLQSWLEREKGIIVTINFLDKTYSEREFSNPLQLLTLAIEEKDFADAEVISVEKIIAKFDNWLKNSHILERYSIHEKTTDKLQIAMQGRNYASAHTLKFEDIENGR